ncbi:MAG: glycosyltransferase involved in cell wall biosynthesis [Candidatus Omnitrophota bacterium]|jgi:glycosyltransferase involved in cell wall biosynthesis
MKIGLIMFSLNEINGMKVTLPRIKSEWVDDIVIIDGGSTDGTIAYAESLGFRVVRQTRKGGIIPAMKEIFEQTDCDFVITFTPDNNMIPEKIPELVAKAREGYDMVVVSRYLDGAKSEDDHLISGFGNWMFTTMVNVLFKTKYTDVLGFYRGYRLALLDELGIDIEPSIDTQLSIRCKKDNKKVIEIPGDEPKRVGGQSSRSIIGHGSYELYTIIREFFNLGRDTRLEKKIN